MDVEAVSIGAEPDDAVPDGVVIVPLLLIGAVPSDEGSRPLELDDIVPLEPDGLEEG